MNITLSIDEQVVKRARKKLQALGKSVNEEIREHLLHIANGDEGGANGWIEELTSLSGMGDSHGWRFNRDELYERR